MYFRSTPPGSSLLLHIRQSDKMRKRNEMNIFWHYRYANGIKMNIPLIKSEECLDLGRLLKNITRTLKDKKKQQQQQKQ